MRFTFVILFYFFTLFFSEAFAKPTRIGKIIIQGNKIVEEEAIRSKITSKVGKAYNKKKIRRDVQQIFSTGWFYKIEVQRKKIGQKIKLIYIVKEKPIVEKIIYEGNSSLSKKELDEIFHFFPHEFLNHKKVKSAIQNISAEYEKKGYYLADISYTIKKTSHPEKVQLVIKIKENKKVKVKRVYFIGNKDISSEEIKSFMGTRETGLLSFISSSGSYSRDTLEKDLNNIRFIYMDKGYWKVFVGKPEILISPDKTDITISIPIKEGEQYKAGTINFTGDLIFTEENLKEGLETEESEIFSYGKLQRDIKRLETKYGDKGHAFVNVIPKFFNLPNDDGKTIHLLFEIQKGKQVEIGKIHISGNDYTRDKVIRREIRIFEGELYNETNKNLSIANIQRLGFFDDVKMIPKTIKNRDDLVDMEVTIKERENTGTLEVGAGYNGYFGFSFSGKLNKFNLFGRGYNIGVDANLSLSRQYMNINFSDPYFMDSRWYFGGDFSLNNWDDDISDKLFSTCNVYDKKKAEHESKVAAHGFGTPEKEKESEGSVEVARLECLKSFPGINYRGFAEQTVGSGITLGRSLTDTLRFLFYYRLERIKLTNTIDETLYPVESASGWRNPMEAIVEYDNRNDRIFPTSGIYARGSLTYDGPFSKFDYFTFSSNFRFYQTLFWELVFRVNIQYSQHLTWSDDKEAVPFNNLFLLGGINSLRGFKYFSIGPRKRSEVIYKKALQYNHPHPENISSRVFGGMKEFYTNLELQFPIFPQAQLLGVVFVDIGTAFDEFDIMELRGNWGFGLRVFSPLGPIRLELGIPFKSDTDLGEKSSEFQFTMGLPF